MLFWEGEVVLGSESKPTGEVLVSAIPFVLGGKEKERQPDIVNDPWPPGLKERRINWVLAAGNTAWPIKGNCSPALLEEPDEVISYIIVYIFSGPEM